MSSTNDDENIGCICNIIYGILVLILVLVAIAIVLIVLSVVLAWAVCTILYLLIEFIAYLVLLRPFYHKESEQNTLFRSFIVNAEIFAIGLALMHAGEVFSSANDIFDYSSIIFPFCTGAIYMGIFVFFVFLSSIIKENLTNRLPRYLIPYTVIVLQAGVGIWVMVDGGTLIYHDIFMATMPVTIIGLIVCTCAIVILFIFKLIRNGYVANYYKEGDKLYQNNNFEKAIGMYQKAYKIEQDKNDYYYYAMCLAEIGLEEHYEAKKYIEEAIELQPENQAYKETLSQLEKLEKEKQSETLYKKSVDELAKKNYIEADKCIEQALMLVSDSETFKKQKEKVKNESASYIEKLYKEASDLYTQKKYELAKSTIQQALDIDKNDTQCKKLSGLIQNEISLLYAADFYESAKKNFNLGYLEIAEKKIKEALTLCPNDNSYKDLLSSILTEKNIRKAKDLYASGNSKLKDDIEGAIKDFQEAVKLNPLNEYKKALEEAKIKRDDSEAEQYLKKAINYLNDGNFEEAKNYFQYVLNYDSDNEEIQKYIAMAEERKLYVSTCTKKGIMTLDCINEELAEQFMSARKDGLIWYSYEELANFLNIQPHQWMEIEEKLAFPLKQAPKYTRKVDL